MKPTVAIALRIVPMYPGATARTAILTARVVGTDWTVQFQGRTLGGGWAFELQHPRPNRMCAAGSVYLDRAGNVVDDTGRSDIPVTLRAAACALFNTGLCWAAWRGDMELSDLVGEANRRGVLVLDESGLVNTSESPGRRGLRDAIAHDVRASFECDAEAEGAS